MFIQYLLRRISDFQRNQLESVIWLLKSNSASNQLQTQSARKDTLKIIGPDTKKFELELLQSRFCALICTYFSTSSACKNRKSAPFFPLAGTFYLLAEENLDAPFILWSKVNYLPQHLLFSFFSFFRSPLFPFFPPLSPSISLRKNQ